MNILNKFKIKNRAILIFLGLMFINWIIYKEILIYKYYSTMVFVIFFAMASVTILLTILLMQDNPLLIIKKYFR